MQIEQLRKHIHITTEKVDVNGPPTINFVQRAKKGIEKPNRRLGVFPASFDPLTKAHLEIISMAQQQQIDEVLLLADKQNADKQTHGAPLEDRLLMLRLFFEEYARISIAISSHGLFLEKIEALNRIYPPYTTTIFLVGYDTIIRVLDRKYYKDREAALAELFAWASFLVAAREGRCKEDIFNLFKTEKTKKFREKIEFLRISPSATQVSATLVRNMLRQGEEIGDLVPERIRQHIENFKLYK